jgi:heptaprenyl diphosphate synthase
VFAATFSFLLLAFAGIPLTSASRPSTASFAPASGVGPERRAARWSSRCSPRRSRPFVDVRLIVLHVLHRCRPATTRRLVGAHAVDRVDTLGADRSARGATVVLGIRAELPARDAATCRRSSCVTRDGGVSAAPGVLELPGARAAPAAATGLAAVDALIAARIDHDDPFIAQASAHLADAGGKRFRPLLTLLAAELGTASRRGGGRGRRGRADPPRLALPRRRDGRGDVRRGHAERQRRYGNSTAILVGDLLFGTASDIVAGLGAEAVRIQAQTFVRLCAGQIRDDRPCPTGTTRRLLPRRARGQDRRADRHGGALRRDVQRRLHERRRGDAATTGAARRRLPARRRPHRHRVRPTSTGKTPGTDLREVCRPCRCSSRCVSGDPADARLHQLLRATCARRRACTPRRCGCCAVTTRMRLAREHTRQVGAEAGTLLAAAAAERGQGGLLALVEGVVDRVG